MKNTNLEVWHSYLASCEKYLHFLPLPGSTTPTFCHSWALPVLPPLTWKYDTYIRPFVSVTCIISSSLEVWCPNLAICKCYLYYISLNGSITPILGQLWGALPELVSLSEGPSPRRKTPIFGHSWALPVFSPITWKCDAHIRPFVSITCIISPYLEEWCPY